MGIYNVVHRPCFCQGCDLFRDERNHRIGKIGRSAADVRRDNDIGALQKLGRNTGIFIFHTVQPSPGQMTFLQTFQQSGIVDQTASGGIQQIC